MLDTSLEIQEHFLDLVVRFSCLLVLLLSLGKISLHIINLFPCHRLQSLKLHLLKIIFDCLSFISKVHQLLFILCLDIFQVLISITLCSKLLQEVIYFGHTCRISNLLFCDFVLFVFLLFYFSKILFLDFFSGLFCDEILGALFFRAGY